MPHVGMEFLPGGEVVGRSNDGNGVEGKSLGRGASGVYGENNNGGYGVAGRCPEGVGVLGEGKIAGRFVGDIEVTGDIRLLGNGQDCAEDFDVDEAAQVEPGTVMVLDQKGALQASGHAYDKRVAGVVSGAGKWKPGIIFGKQESMSNRVPIALMGKVYCKVDAHYAPIQVGDLLTTSPTPGHAMKADDPMKAFGSVIGKAMADLPTGQALIPMLIALQ